MSLKLNNISFKVALKNGDAHEIIKDISIEIQPGEIVTLFGKSGCGKSTLLNIISGLVKPTQGSISYNGNDVIMPFDKIAFVFQETALFPYKTIQSNVEFGLELKGVERNQRKKISKEVLKKVGLFEHRKKYPSKDKISGGMKQRAEIAGVLADQSPVILMDEPFSALDDITREDMQSFVLEIWREFNKTILFVTHNKDEAILLSDRIILLPSSPENGKVEVLDVDLSRPRNSMSLEFLSYKKILTNHLKK